MPSPCRAFEYPPDSMSWSFDITLSCSRMIAELSSSSRDVPSLCFSPDHAGRTLYGLPVMLGGLGV